MQLGFIGMLLVGTGVTSTVSLSVSTVVFLTLVVLKMAVEIRLAPYKQDVELNARLLSQLLIVVTVACMVSNLLLEQESLPGEQAQGRLFVALAWGAAVLNFVGIAVGVCFICRAPVMMAWELLCPSRQLIIQ